MKVKLPVIVLVLMLAICVWAQSGGTFTITRSVISSGGDPKSGGTFTLDSTSGQALAGTTSGGGSFINSSGFRISAAPNSISGTVTYGNAAAPPKYISNVTVTGTGSPTVMTTTAAPGVTAGQYTLTGFGSGSYTVSLSKTTGQNSITSNDAARIAQSVAGTLPLTTNNQKVSADVSGNGAVSSNDAAKIAQFVAGVSPLPPPNLTGQWQFYLPPGPTFPIAGSPTSRTYPSVTTNLTGEDYIGLLIGEVTGNWVPGAARASGSSRVAGSYVPEKPISVELPDLATEPDKEILIPVHVQAAKDKQVISYEFNLRYDASVIQPTIRSADLTDTVSRGLSVVTNPSEPGLLRVVVYGAMPIDQDGVLLNLRFAVVGAPGSVSPLVFERLMFNEGGRAVDVTSGEVVVQ